MGIVMEGKVEGRSGSGRQGKERRGTARLGYLSRGVRVSSYATGDRQTDRQRAVARTRAIALASRAGKKRAYSRVCVRMCASTSSSSLRRLELCETHTNRNYVIEFELSIRVV